MSTPQNSDFGPNLRSLGNKGKLVNLPVTPVTSKTLSSKTATVQTVTNDSLPTLPITSSSVTQQTDEREVNFSTETMSHPHVTIESFSGLPGQKGENWLKSYSNICKAVYNYNEEKVKSTFPFHLVGQAKAWYKSLPDRITSDNDELISQFVARFDGSDGGYSIGMVRQKTNESVHDYTTRFQELSNGADMPTRWLVTNYVDGLVPCLRRIVKPQELGTLDLADVLH